MGRVFYRRGDYCKLSWTPDWDMSSDEHKVRELTKDEISDLYTLVGFMRGSYLKRLQTYYKNYFNKIGTYGYWSNC